MQRDTDGPQAARELEVERVADRVGAQPLIAQQPAGEELRLGGQPEQQVLSLYARAALGPCLVARQTNDLAQILR